MFRIFVDANVLIAGAASKKGASRAILMLAEIGLVELVVSRQILDEVERNLRKKLPQSLPVFAEVLAAIPLQIVADPPEKEVQPWTSVIEVKDAPLIAAATREKVERFVTLNTRDFTPEGGKKSGLKIQTPGEFMQDLRQILQERLR
ncbi:MAG: PIN domain-containing protein [Ardenticatenaceae bacterium]|nr:PIN domain-containing protein [Ardenticatenaceae bacterium]